MNYYNYDNRNFYERLKQFLPPVTLNLIIINALVWFAQFVFGRLGFNLANMFGLHYFEAEQFRLWQFVTYAFLHDESSIAHLFFNMFSLFMFGGAIERLWGRSRFLTFYIVCALTAALTQQIFWYTQFHDVVASGATIVTFSEGGQMLATSFLNRVLTIGASGSVFGLLLAFGMLFPNASIYMMFIPIPIKAKYFVAIYGLVELFLGISGTNDGIAHFAHLGGMIGGIVLILLWRKKGYIDRPYV